MSFFVLEPQTKPKTLLLAIANTVNPSICRRQKVKEALCNNGYSECDDSTFGALGRYECHAFAVGDPVERKHGFTVNVIASKL